METYLTCFDCHCLWIEDIDMVINPCEKHGIFKKEY